MKKAYIVTVYNEIDYLNRFVETLLSDGTSEVFIHLDKNKEQLRSNIHTNEHIHFIKNNQAIEWGGWSFMQAIVESWREVLAHDAYDYIILCSGQDILLRRDMDAFLEEHPNEVFISSWEDDRTRRAFLLYKWPHRYFRIIDTKWSLTRLMRVARIWAFAHGFPFMKRKLTYDVSQMTFYKNWWWSVLPAEVVLWIVDYIHQHPDYLEVFHGFVAEEGFIATSIMLSPYHDWIKRDDSGHSYSLTFRKPSVNNHPPVLTGDDIEEAERSGLFFARKVDMKRGRDFVEHFMNKDY